MEKIIKRNFKEKMKELEQNYKIFKEIDLEKDIDTEASDYYKFDKKNNQIVFWYGKNESIFKNKGKFVYREASDEGEEIVLKMEAEWTEGVFKDIYRFDYEFMSDKLLVCNVDANQLEGRITETKEYFILNLSNDDGFLENRSSLEEFNKYNDTLQYNNYKAVQMVMFRERSMFNAFDKTDKDYVNILEVDTLAEENEFILDMQGNCLYVNGIRDFPKAVTFGEELKYISLNCIRKKQGSEFKINKEGIRIAEKTGYIYLKPIQVENGVKPKLIIISKGNLEYEIYDDVTQDWKNAKDIKFEGGELKVRIKMSIYEKISKIFLAEEK